MHEALQYEPTIPDYVNLVLQVEIEFFFFGDAIHPIVVLWHYNNSTEHMPVFPMRTAVRIRRDASISLDMLESTTCFETKKKKNPAPM